MIRRLVSGDPRRQAALAAGLALVILLGCWWAATQWYRARLVFDERIRVLAQVNTIGTALTSAVDRRIDGLDGLAAFVQSDPSEEALAAHFDTYAGAVYPTVGGVRSSRIYIGGIDRLVYPLAGNESAVGLNIFEHPSPTVRDAVQRALQTRRTTLVGPYDLGRGGSGLLATRPIFFGDDFWGFAVIILEVPPILQDAGLGADPGSHPSGLSLAVKDSLGQVFYGAPDAFAADPITYTIELPEGAWTLAGVPAGGWEQAVRNPLRLFEATGLMIVGLLASVTYLNTNRQARLRLAVNERTRQIAQINTTLERQAALLDLAHDAILVRDLRGEISFWNPGAEQLYGWSRSEAVGTISHELLQTVFPESLEALESALQHDGRWHGELIHTQRDGGRIYVSSRQVLQRTEQGHPGIVMEINRDITERKQAEEALERRVAERTRELSALLDLARTAGSTLDLRPLLELILEQLRTAVEYTNAVIVSNQDGGTHTIVEYRGLIARELVVGREAPPELAAALDESSRRRGPLLVEDWEAWGEGPPIGRVLAREGVSLPPEAARSARGGLIVPLIVRGAVVGNLAVSHTTVGFYTDRDAGLAMAFAQQAAIAIENARLYEAARERAALEERQRLARELHDSVSQVLYAIVLIASSAEEVRDSAPDRLPRLHGQVLSLAEAGLAELRALIFELRPESLEREGLVAALEKQAAAVQVRHGVTVRFDLGDEPDLPIATKEALYRIAQEALQNAVKHARAQSIELVLGEAAGELRLCVVDDGIGFEAVHDFPGHLGLHTMRERADGIGGTLELDSTPGGGTRVVARLPLPVGLRATVDPSAQRHGRQCRPPDPGIAP